MWLILWRTFGIVFFIALLPGESSEGEGEEGMEGRERGKESHRLPQGRSDQVFRKTFGARDGGLLIGP